MQEYLTVPQALSAQGGQNGAGEDSVAVAVVAPDGGAQIQTTHVNDGIAGMSAMRGLLLYAAVLLFAGLYVYFMVIISAAKPGAKPTIDASLISAAAALSGVLGSAFALKLGVAPNPSQVNSRLAADAARAGTSHASALLAGFRKALSLEPAGTTGKSWPLTFGMWAYAVVASAVVVVYVLNQNETPGAVKALAVTFGGYVIALIHMVYSMGKPGDTA